MNNNVTHLTEDQIIISVIDQNDLDDYSRQHLQDCSFCKEQNMKLSLSLSSLSKKAEDLIKPPQLNIVTLFSKKKKSYTFEKPFAGLFLRPALSFVIIIICATSFYYLPGSKQNIIQDSKIASTLSSEALFTEIEQDLAFAETMDNLENYALSGFITSSDNEDYNIDEFIEFVTPTNNETI